MTSSLYKPRSNTLSPPAPKLIANALAVDSITIEWLAGDGSDRCYYRLFSPQLPEPRVLMQLSGSDALALQKGGYDWIKIAKLLAGRGIFVPEVCATMPEHAALIIEDYGNQMLETLVLDLLRTGRTSEVKSVYRECLGLIGKMLAIPRDTQATWCQRGFDIERLRWELNFFMQQYGVPVAGLNLTASEAVQFAGDIERLAQTLAEGSSFFVHRDFHSRNIMVKGQKLAVIDFQDARLGPAAYDLVSLCFDSYMPFSGPLRAELLQEGLRQIQLQAGDQAQQAAQTLWKPMLLQRQLKAIGSFGYLTLDKKRGDYLKNVPAALATLEEQALYDDRWPFISGTLLDRLRQALGVKKT